LQLWLHWCGQAGWPLPSFRGFDLIVAVPVTQDQADVIPPVEMWNGDALIFCPDAKHNLLSKLYVFFDDDVDNNYVNVHCK
jgi:hypothetical protein